MKVAPKKGENGDGKNVGGGIAYVCDTPGCALVTSPFWCAHQMRGHHCCSGCMCTTGVAHTSDCVREGFWPSGGTPGRLQCYGGAMYADGSCCLGVSGKSAAFLCPDGSIIGDRSAIGDNIYKVVSAGKPVNGKMVQKALF